MRKLYNHWRNNLKIEKCHFMNFMINASFLKSVMRISTIAAIYDFDCQSQQRLSSFHAIITDLNNLKMTNN